MKATRLNEEFIFVCSGEEAEFLLEALTHKPCAKCMLDTSKCQSAPTYCNGLMAEIEGALKDSGQKGE